MPGLYRESADSFGQLIVTSELIEGDNHISPLKELVNPLFEELAFFINLEGAEVLATLEYAKQVVIMSLLKIIRYLKVKCIFRKEGGR